MIDWKRKLTSRKFWATVAEFVSMLLVAFGKTEDAAVKITALIMAGAGVVAYIIGEGLTDVAAIKNENVELILDEDAAEEVKTDVD